MVKYIGKIVLLTMIGVMMAVSGIMAQSSQSQPTQPRRRLSIPNMRQTQPVVTSNPSDIKVARLHYSGGGDWYWGGSAIPNFLRYLRDNTDYPVDTVERQVTIDDPDLFKYPFLFATGHGIIRFSAEEKEQLRKYLAGGGFLFVNDSYGMDRTFRKEMADLFLSGKLSKYRLTIQCITVFMIFPTVRQRYMSMMTIPREGTLFSWMGGWCCISLWSRILEMAGKTRKYIMILRKNVKYRSGWV